MAVIGFAQGRHKRGVSGSPWLRLLEGLPSPISSRKESSLQREQPNGKHPCRQMPTMKGSLVEIVHSPWPLWA
jgi:hypothetical protein